MKTASLGEVCHIEYGKRVVRKKDAGTLYPVYGGGGKTFSVDSTNRKDRVVISRFAMSEQCTRFVHGEFFLNDSGLTVSPKDENELWASYLNWVMIAMNDVIYSLGRGASQRNLNVEAFRKLPITYPELSKQKSIVSAIETAFAGLRVADRKTTRQLTYYRMLKPALLASRLPQGDVRLDEVATVAAGNTAPQEKEFFDGGSHIFIRTSDVGKIKVGRIDSSRDLLNDKGIKKLRKHPKGTILFPKSGESTRSNHRVIMDSDGYVSSHLATIKGIEGKVIDEYLFMVLQTIDAADFVPESSYPHLSLKVIKSIPVPLPSLEEQTGVVDDLNATFSEVDKAIVATTAQVNCFRALKPVLLATMLKEE